MSLFGSAATEEPAVATAFLHPHGAHLIELGGHSVGYALRRSRRRSIGFVVGVDGLAVNAPAWVGVRVARAACGRRPLPNPATSLA